MGLRLAALLNHLSSVTTFTPSDSHPPPPCIRTPRIVFLLKHLAPGTEEVCHEPKYSWTLPCLSMFPEATPPPQLLPPRSCLWWTHENPVSDFLDLSLSPFSVLQSHQTRRGRFQVLPSSHFLPTSSWIEEVSSLPLRNKIYDPSHPGLK